MSTFAFDTQILLETTVLGNQRHQRLRLVCVQLISDKNPEGFWSGLDGLLDVGNKIFLRASWSNRWSNDLTRGNFKISNQALRAMTDIFKLFPLNMCGPHWQ